MMKLKEVGTIRAVGRKSKYAGLVAAVEGSFEANGADGQYRAIVGTERHSLRWQEKAAAAVRDHGKRHPKHGLKLSVRLCRDNGICFAWKEASKASCTPTPATSEAVS